MFKITLYIPTIMLLSVGTTVVIADNNVTFPPAQTIPSYSFPPQVVMNGNKAPTYAFGQQPSRNNSRPNNNFQNFRSFPSQGNGSMPRYPKQYNQYGSVPSGINNIPFSTNGNNMMPFGNGSNFGMPSNPMNNMFGNNNSMPFFGNNNNNSMPFFGNNNNSSMPFFGNTRNSNRKKAWGTERNIWPDFYTDFTDEAWDTVTRGPRDLGEMPGGWRFPHISTPDPVTVSDAITNQFPPIMEEGGNMMDFSDWGVFD